MKVSTDEISNVFTIRIKKPFYMSDIYSKTEKVLYTRSYMTINKTIAKTKF